MITSTAVPPTPTPPPTQQEQLAQLQRGLDFLRAGTIDAAALTAIAQQQWPLTDALPPRFKEVLGQLLNRIEASVLFTDESCSFSRNDLLDSMQLWIDKAALQLAPPDERP